MIVGPVELTNFMTSRNFRKAVYVFFNVRNTSGRHIKQIGFVFTPLNKFGDPVGEMKGFDILDLPPSSNSLFGNKVRKVKSPFPLWNDASSFVNGIQVDGVVVKYMDNEEKQFITGGGNQYKVVKTDIAWMNAPLR